MKIEKPDQVKKNSEVFQVYPLDPGPSDNDSDDDFFEELTKSKSKQRESKDDSTVLEGGDLEDDMFRPVGMY